MSWEATAWAKRTRGHRSSGQKLVLMVLADYAHPENYQAWPSQSMISEDCEIPLRTVQRHLANLEKQGFIVTVRKGNQHQPTLYKLAVTVAGSQTHEPAKGEPAKMTPAQVNPPSRTSEPAISNSEPAISQNVYRKEPPIRTSKEPSTRMRTRSASEKPDPRVKEILDSLEAVRGFKSPNYAAEGKSAKLMLSQGYDSEDILSCYRWLKGDAFWWDKTLTLPSVHKQIGTWITLGRPAVKVPRAPPSQNGQAPIRKPAGKAPLDW